MFDGFLVDCWSRVGEISDLFSLFFATWRKLEKSHGAEARAPKLRAWGVGNGVKIKKARAEFVPKN